jgi:hypothetical protein
VFRPIPRTPTLPPFPVLRLLAALLLAGPLAGAPVPAVPVKLPSGFVREVLAGPEVPEPMDLAFAPDGAAWITGRGGQLWRLDTVTLRHHLVGQVPTDTAGDRGLHGIAFHPDFSATSGGDVFLFHHATSKPAGVYRSRVSRWHVSGSGAEARLNPDSGQTLLEFDGQEGGQHVGGGLLVHPVERLLYVTTGDNNKIWELKSYCGDTNNQAQSPGDLRGKVLRIATMGLAVKKYPMCFATHRTLDAILDLVNAHDLRPGHVTQVRATIGRAQASMLRNHAPVTGLEAKFSLEFAVAAALVSRKVGLAELTDAYVNRPEVRSIFGRVQIATTDTVSAAEPTLAASDRVVVETADGKVFDSGEVAGTRGDANSPVSREEMRVKFLDCVRGAPGIDGEALFENLMQLGSISDISTLARP